MRTNQLSLVLLIALLTFATAATAQLAPSEKIVSATMALSVDKLRPGDSFQVAVVGTVRKGYHIGAHHKDALYPAKVSLSAPREITFGKPAYPPAKFAAARPSTDKVPVYEGRFVIRVTGKVSRDARPGTVTLKAVLNTQACKGDMCFPPEATRSDLRVKVATPGTRVRKTNAALFASAGKTGGSGSEADKVSDRLAKASWPARLVIVFVIGLVLAFTPCVYPMIPVTVGYFSGQSGKGQTRQAVGLAAAYIFGLALTYAALGAVAATTGGLIGSAMQRPAVVVGIAAVLVALALSMFGLYELRPPRFIERRGYGRSGTLGALVMGAIFGAVAAPCVGPAVLGLAVYVANVGAPAMGFLLFFALALGLGTPLFFLAAFSARLPAPGMWMVAVRKIGGFLLLGAAAYFIQPIVPWPIRSYLIPAVIVAAGAYLAFFEKGMRSSRATASFGKAFGAAAIIAAVALLIPRGSGPVLTWEPYSVDAVAGAAAVGQPSMIDFTADWCAVCKELEHGPFSDPAVIRAAERFRRFRVDGTDRGDRIMLAAVKRYGVGGFPTVVFLDGQGQEVRAVRVVGYVGSEEMIRRMEAVR
mgnify:CR=1 FL=1